MRDDSKDNLKAPKKGFDADTRKRLMESFEKLEQEGLLPERDLRAIYSSKTSSIPDRPALTVQQINERFARMLAAEELK